MEKQGLCTECAHYDSCTEPCIFVQMALRKENIPWLSERKSGDNAIVLKNKRARYFSPANGPGPNSTAEVDRIPDDEEHGLAQFMFEPKTLQTRIFCDRFFLRLSYAEIAERHGMTSKQVGDNYVNACKRIHQVLKQLDGRDNAIRYFRNPGRENALTDAEKWWILNRVFGHTAVEIAEMVNCHPSVITRSINALQRKWKSKYYRELTAVSA